MSCLSVNFCLAESNSTKTFLASTGALEEVMSDLCVYTLCNRALRMALKEFLQHSKEFRGVLEESSRES